MTDQERSMRYGAEREARRGRQEGLRDRDYEGETARDRDYPSFREDFRGRGPRGYRRSNERIREDVCEGLTDDPTVDASEIEVQVEDAIVLLSGLRRSSTRTGSTTHAMARSFARTTRVADGPANRHTADVSA